MNGHMRTSVSLRYVRALFPVAPMLLLAIASTLPAYAQMGVTVDPKYANGALSGKSKLPVAHPTPKQLNFGKLAAGTTSPSHNVTFKNNGPGALTAPAIAVSGAFSLSSNGCTSAIDAGNFCVVSVAFKPTSTGKFKGSLTFTDGAAKSPQKVKLSGVGLRAAATPTATPTPTATASATATATPTATATATSTAKATATSTATASPTATATAVAAHGAYFISDSGNLRVHAFLPPFSDDMDAGLAIGAPDLTSRGNASATQSTINQPGAVAFDKTGNLWVPDEGNNRVLEFLTPFSTGMNASVVLGQSDFMSVAAGGVGQANMNTPQGVAVDASGDVFVANTSFNRVLEYKPPITNGMNASVVIGQPDFVTGNANTTQAGLNFPTFVRMDSSGNLWVSDQFNSRVLEFKPPFATGMTASLVLGQTNFTSGAAATTQSGMANPHGLAFDNQMKPDLFVADGGNNRVLEFEPPFSNGMNASVVLCEPDFTTGLGSPGTTKSTCSSTIGVSFDAGGNLFVVDALNNRALEFEPPFSNGMDASVVFGQPDFVTRSAGAGISGLDSPEGGEIAP